MGIRIKRKMGFALTDVDLNQDGEVSDSRINPNWHNRLYSKTIREYSEFCENNIDKILTPEQSPLFLNSFGWDSESTFKERANSFIQASENEMTLTTDEGKGVFLITPIMLLKEWSHNDDSFDYFDYYERMPKADADVLKGIITPLSYNPFPYSGDYMDRRTFKKIDQELERFYKDDNFDWDKIPVGYQELLLEKNAFHSYEHFEENVTWSVPVELFVFSKWLNLFTSDDVWLQLRPTMITYWS